MSNPISLADFLATTPPNSDCEVLAPLVESRSYQNAHILKLPDLSLHCPADPCERFQIFSPKDRDVRLYLGNSYEYFWHYTCRNCGQTSKIFAVIIAPKDLHTSAIYKIGEIPPFGVPTPTRLLSILGTEKDYFLKGRRSENQSLGIGAFAYYRRVVENQKDRIFNEIIKVAKLTNAPPSIVDSLSGALKETQFTKAVESLKGAIPDSLLIDGHNPLTLLHAALSEGLHSHSDEDCLKRAETIRLVLSTFAERIAELTRDHAEFKSAVSRLLSPKKSK